MKTVLKTSFTLALIAAIGAGTFPVFAASAPEAAPPAARHLRADFAKAKAIAPRSLLPPAPAERVPETDGLSRNVEDCNYGCIDN